jgi:hypothetical protein
MIMPSGPDDLDPEERMAPREFDRPRGLDRRAGRVGGHQVERRPRRLGGGPRPDPGVLRHGGSPFCS